MAQGKCTVSRGKETREHVFKISGDSGIELLQADAKTCSAGLTGTNSTCSEEDNPIEK